ncbi:uncharacterized protein Hap1MRO34_011056 isoform 1-T2 [Clarias gariepinus]|uniref:uncharacterized protein LOC128530569 n=1 Tax=Clarias gariepinus TaxID=13013 RepID=UPI00234DC32C|nr:uncharacterized protein LOC128530569 [Clarias gariepinus]XP_053360566.1 uncharacterized protein LOC128530569 [Clarias gariepinus]XP_053360567.1 uncharacterized protein LOC128530569 [Clarias gariepinus]
MGKDLFFPNGLSTKGSAEDFNFHVCDFKRNPISLGDIVGLLYEQTKLKLLRFYICTRDTDLSNQTGSGGDIEEYSSDSESWDVLEKEAFLKNATTGEDLELQEHTSKKSKRWSPESPNETRALAIQNTNTDDATSNTKPCMGDEGDTLFPDSQIHWDPENEEHERTEVEDVIVINLCLDNADDVTELFMDNEEVNEPVSTTLSYKEPLLSAKSPHERVETSLQSNSEILPGDFASESENYSNSSTTNDDLANSRAVHYVSVHRITILKDLIVAYLDPNILQCTLKMEFVNEKAIDDSGVSRDMYTAFWEQFLEQCEGEEERVPRLRLDFSEDEWQAVGRIWAKGFLDHGVLPIRLSKSFILASIHGIDAVDVHVLLSSFLNYLSSNERVIIERALQGTLEENDEEDLLDLFTRMGSQCLPPKDNMESAIQTMAHKAILQEPKYIVDCFSKAMSCVQLNLSDKKSVLSLYEMKKATGKKVSQLLQTTKEMLTQQEQATFNHLQLYVRNADQKKAEQFLRFCTGSSVMCVDKINVCFNAESGLSRRPVAHTCGATLKVSYTYSSYPEFRTEFDNILSSNYLKMDII